MSLGCCWALPSTWQCPFEQKSPLPPPLCPRDAPSHTCLELYLVSAPQSQHAADPSHPSPSAGSWFTRRRVLASQTSLPVHNTFPAIHNLIYVTIAPINNSVGQLRNYSLKGPANLVLPVPRSLCLAVPGGPTCWAGGGVAPSAPIVCPTHGCPPAFATRQHLPALHPPISSPAPPQHPRSSTLMCMHTAATGEARAKIRPCSANPPAKCDFPLLQFPVAHIKALMRAQDEAASESPAPWPPAPCIHHQGFGDGHASPRGPQHPASPFLSAQPVLPLLPPQHGAGAHMSPGNTGSAASERGGCLGSIPAFWVFQKLPVPACF